MQPVRVRLQAEVELTFEEEDLAAPKVRGRFPKTQGFSNAKGFH